MAEPLKNMYSDASIKALAGTLKKHAPDFDTAKFLRFFSDLHWKEAELKARVHIIASAIRASLPYSYEDSLKVLIAANSKIPRGFFSIFLPDFVEQFGLEHWKESMSALREFTRTSTAEYAIRPFIEKHPEKTMKLMLTWSEDADVDIRRLSSEGCRPRLPWGMKLQRFVNDPAQVLQILENLKTDSELYVRKSVANNLNDISKDHPELAIQIARAWFGKNEETDWIVRHGLRTLLKKGNKNALAIFGHHNAKGIRVENLTLSNKALRIGGTLEFQFDVVNTTRKELNCRVEYAIDYRKSNASLSRKVFQISRLALDPGALSFSRKQRFTDFTTRKHYPGEHEIHILINGDVMASKTFMLRKS